MAPLISHVYELGFMEAISIPQTECFKGNSSFLNTLCTLGRGSLLWNCDSNLCFAGITGAIQFARSEGLIPAPEPTHAIAATIREALKCKETGEAKVILTAMCGHGHFDLPAYDNYLQGNLVDLTFEDEKIQAALASVPQVGC